MRTELTITKAQQSRIKLIASFSLFTKNIADFLGGFVFTKLGV